MHENWKFTGSTSIVEFQTLPLLTSFLQWLIIDTEDKNISEKRDESSK